jgi:hypothetical protein
MADRWQKLRKEVDDLRANREHHVATLTNDITRRLKRLAVERHCSPTAIGWIQHRRNGATTKIDFRPNADGRDARGHPAVRLHGLDHLADGAVLTLSIDLERDRLESYTVSIVGRKREGSAATPSPFYARIDLDDDPKGRGLCGHPLLHCHVGADPEPNDKFSPRAPLPWLHPADALDWLLSTVHPPLEPRST